MMGIAVEGVFSRRFVSRFPHTLTCNRAIVIPELHEHGGPCDLGALARCGIGADTFDIPFGQSFVYEESKGL